MSSARVRRVLEVGRAGIARRIRHRVSRSRVAEARRRWHALYAEGSLEERIAQAAPSGLERAVSALAAGAPRRFFFDASDTALRSAFARRHAAGAHAIRREADAALAGDLAWVVPGGSSDWHAALPNGGRWPCTSDPGIDAAAPRGDVRLSWEIGRSTHVVRLAQAAWLFEERRYAAAVTAQLDDFAAANPPGLGIAWLHAQEVAIRAVAWLWALHLVGARGFERAALQRLVWLLLAHGDYVAAHLADDPITHNHLVSESAGLLILGLALPELARAAAWRRIGAQVLWRELAKQVDEEGVHGEHATHYHAFVLDSFLAALLLSERAGLAVPAWVRPRIGAMVELVAMLLGPDGRLPAIGDTDSGRAWRLAAGDPLDRRDLLATAAIAFGRADWGASAGDAAGAFWIGGGRPVPGAADPTPPGGARCFRAAGIGVARTGFDRDAESVVLRAGPTRFRPDVLRAHMHADALSVLWRVGSDDVLLDPGTFLYSESEGWRAWLRGTSSHSCVVVDGCSQADVASQRFGIQGETTSRWLAFAGDATRLCAAAEHPAAGPLRIRRRLAWRAGGLLALCDDVAGAGAHRIESWFQLPATEGGATQAGAALRLASGRRLRLDVAGPLDTIEVLRPGPGAGPGPGWLAPRYGVRAPGTAIRIAADVCALPLRQVVVFQLGDAPPAAQIVFAADGGVRIGTERASIEFSGDGATHVEGAQ